MVRHLLYVLPASWSHFLSIVFLKLRAKWARPQHQKWASFSWNQIHFTNPLGTAGGLDKSGHLIKGWWTYGPGFVEVGTVTPKKQKSHAGVILRKHISKKALWNYMGFPNRGSSFVQKKLKSLPLPHFTPIFVSIGKNRDTSLETSSKDYTFLLKALNDYADVFVLNISSPNTAQLRRLFEHDFESFLTTVLKTRDQLRPRRPVLLKMSPDVSNSHFLHIIEMSEKLGIDGWIVCNATVKKDPLPFPSYGGVSGRPLDCRSKELLQLLVSFLGSRKHTKLIVSCGGVLTPADVLERLKMGADLVQVYSALVFESPYFFQQTGDFYLSQIKK